MRPTAIPSLLPNIMGCFCLSLWISAQYVNHYHLRFWTTSVSAFGQTFEDLVLRLRTSTSIWDFFGPVLQEFGIVSEILDLSLNIWTDIWDFELMSEILDSCLRIWTDIWDFGRMTKTFHEHLIFGPAHQEFGIVSETLVWSVKKQKNKTWTNIWDLWLVSTNFQRQRFWARFTGIWDSVWNLRRVCKTLD